MIMSASSAATSARKRLEGDSLAFHVAVMSTACLCGSVAAEP